MRSIGSCVVMLGLFAVGFMAFDWFTSAMPPAIVTGGREETAPGQRVFTWAAFVAVVAVAVALSGLATLLAPRRPTNPEERPQRPRR